MECFTFGGHDRTHDLRARKMFNALDLGQINCSGFQFGGQGMSADKSDIFIKAFKFWRRLFGSRGLMQSLFLCAFDIDALFGNQEQRRGRILS